MEQRRRKTDTQKRSREYTGNNPENSKNLSDRTLNPAEKHLLQEGMNFNLHRNCLKIHEIIPPVERAPTSLSSDIVDQARLRICSILKTQKTITSNISTEKRRALITLKQDQSIQITKVDGCLKLRKKSFGRINQWAT